MPKGLVQHVIDSSSKERPWQLSCLKGSFKYSRAGLSGGARPDAAAAGCAGRKSCSKSLSPGIQFISSSEDHPGQETPHQQLACRKHGWLETLSASKSTFCTRQCVHRQILDTLPQACGKSCSLQTVESRQHDALQTMQMASHAAWSGVPALTSSGLSQASKR